MLNSIVNYYVIPQRREGLGDVVKTLSAHVRLAVITAIAVGPTAATILTGSPGVLDLVRRNGAGSQSVDEVLVLVGLRLSQVQGVDQSSLLLNLGVLSLHLDRNLLVMQLPIVGIVILHDVGVETIHLCKLIIAHAAETVLKTIELVDDGLVVEASLDFSTETAIHAASGNHC